MKISRNSVNLEVVCWPILSREADDEFRPDAAGAAARRGAVSEAGAAPDVDSIGLRSGERGCGVSEATGRIIPTA
jgi:hypothetical protein